MGQIGSSSYAVRNAPPTAVEAARIFKCKQAVCGETFTAVRTTGGYVYLLGVMGSHVQLRQGQNRQSVLMKRLLLNQAASTRGLSTPRSQGHENHPYTFPDISSYFAAQLTAGTTFIAILSDDGCALIADDCMDLIKLPCRERDQVQTLVAVNNVLYGQSDAVLYEWREPHLQANTGLLLRNLVVAGRYACPLHTWPGAVFKPDPRIGRVKLATGGSDVSAVLAECAHTEYPLELLGSVNPKGRGQYIQGVLDRRASITGDEEGLSKVLLRRLRLEQGQRIACVYKLLTQRLRWSLSLLKEFGAHKEVALRTYRIAAMPTVLSKTFYRLHLAQLASAWSSLRHCWSVTNLRRFSVQLEEQHNRGEAVRSLVRLLAGLEMTTARKAALNFFTCHNVWKLHRRNSQTVLTMLRRQALKAAAGLQRQTLRQWSNYVIRQHISAQGVHKLVAALVCTLRRTGFRVLVHHAGNQWQRDRTLGRLMRRLLSQHAHIAQLRALGRWKAVGQYRTSGHLKAVQTSCRVLCSRLKLLVKRKVYRESFPQLQRYVYSRSWEQTNKVQVVCLVSILSKVRCRYLSSIFHTRLRARTNSTQVAAGLSRLSALRTARLRTALGLVAHSAAARHTQRAFRMALVLSRAQDRLTRLLMRQFFHVEQSQVVSESSFSPITPEREWRRSFPSEPRRKPNLSMPFARWDTMSEHREYYAPDETPAFLSMDVAEDLSKPAELEVTPTASLSPRPLHIDHLDQQVLECSGQSSGSLSAFSLSLQGSPSKHLLLHQRPPWRAPQPTGASRTLATAGSPRTRRLQYSKQLKNRMQKSLNWKQSMGSPTKSQRRGSSSTMTDESVPQPELPYVLAAIVMQYLKEVFVGMKRRRRRNVHRSEGEEVLRSLPMSTLERNWEFRVLQRGRR